MPADLGQILALATDIGPGMTTLKPDAAMQCLGKHGRIDLPFSDVISPGVVTATALAMQARAQHPQLRVLFTSGYTENAMIHNGRLDEGINLLSKPYGRADLARAVRRLLSAPVAQEPASVA